MSSISLTAKILIATDNTEEGQQVQQLLEPHFDDVSISCSEKAIEHDFQAVDVDVLVLTFDSIEKANLFCKALYGIHPTLRKRHRTILLCTKSELTAAFELCKKQHFDDYVLHWPMSYDGKRLPMSVWTACREIAAARTAESARVELMAHARKLEELNKAVEAGYVATAQRTATTQRAFVKFESEVTGAHNLWALMDNFDSREAKGASVEALGQEGTRLKAVLAEKSRAFREEALNPMLSLSDELRATIEPALSSAREFSRTAAAARPLILVVEDDQTIQEVLIRAMDPSRYEVTIAGDCAIALSILRNIHPDVILMDIRLPGVDGVSFVRCLKASTQLAQIPIIVMSSDARRATLVESMDAGAVDFIVKPVKRKTLQTKIEKVLAAVS